MDGSHSESAFYAQATTDYPCATGTKTQQEVRWGCADGASFQGRCRDSRGCGSGAEAALAATQSKASNGSNGHSHGCNGKARSSRTNGPSNGCNGKASSRTNGPSDGCSSAGGASGDTTSGSGSSSDSDGTDGATKCATGVSADGPTGGTTTSSGTAGYGAAADGASADGFQAYDASYGFNGAAAYGSYGPGGTTELRHLGAGNVSLDDAPYGAAATAAVSASYGAASAAAKFAANAAAAIPLLQASFLRRERRYRIRRRWRSAKCLVKGDLMYVASRNRVSFRSLEGWQVVDVRGSCVRAVSCASEGESDAVHVFRSVFECVSRSACAHVCQFGRVHAHRTSVQGLRFKAVHAHRTAVQGLRFKAVHAHRAEVQGLRFKAVHAHRSAEQGMRFEAVHAHRSEVQGMRCEAEHVHRSAVCVCFSKFVLQGKRRLPVLRLRVIGSGRCEDGLVKAEQCLRVVSVAAVMRILSRSWCTVFVR